MPQSTPSLVTPMFKILILVQRGVGGGGALAVAPAPPQMLMLCSACVTWLALLGLHCLAQLALLGLRCSAHAEVLRHFHGMVVGGATPPLRGVRESGGRSAVALLGWRCRAGVGGLARKEAVAAATAAAATEDVPQCCWGGGGGAALTRWQPG
jgi:hypothetical protein